MRRMRTLRRTGPIGIALSFLLASCAQTPMGPTVQIMPGPGKSFDQFQTDQIVCKQFAQQAVSGQAQNANLRGLGAAALTTALGAGLGAAIGGGHGAAIGAAGGAVGGGGIGALTSSRAQNSIQGQYNNAYAQCMYSKGNQVPGFAPAAPPPPPVAYPPPGVSLTQAVQIQLIRLGLLQGSADGVLGPQTIGAISNFERANGLPADGAPSPTLLARLQATQ
ncbi:MAG TPA: peptidoglycan-binding domain-containing protein [Acetobacteraceae bacterium]|nr:peptidoglycan-binding domain-containing protein [Acetobacteraceae bacterium]